MKKYAKSELKLEGLEWQFPKVHISATQNTEKPEYQIQTFGLCITNIANIVVNCGSLASYKNVTFAAEFGMISEMVI